jgi:hypothetical protein
MLQSVRCTYAVKCEVYVCCKVCLSNHGVDSGWAWFGPSYVLCRPVTRFRSLPRACVCPSWAEAGLECNDLSMNV